MDLDGNVALAIKTKFIKKVEWKFKSVTGELRRVFLFDEALKTSFGSAVKKLQLLISLNQLRF